MSVCSCKRKVKGEKTPRCYLKKNRQLCTQLRQKVILKIRYTGQKYTFKHVIKKNSTRLLGLVWQYFDRYVTKQEMEWSILHHANKNIGGVSKICQICNLERMAIEAEDSKQ